MSKYYSPRDYDCIGFGGSRRWVPISDEEKAKRAGKGKSKKNKHLLETHEQATDRDTHTVLNLSRLNMFDLVQGETIRDEEEEEGQNVFLWV